MDELIRELKAQGVLSSPLVERAFRVIDRRDFVLPHYRTEAYRNYPLPIGGGQTISQPYTVAFMLEHLDPRPGEKILDIGAGSGWQTALLAHVVSQPDKGRRTKNKGTVYALERIPELCRLARANLEKYNFLKGPAVEFFCRDATAGLPERAPFDKIIVAAAAAREIPEAWRRQVRIGGKIVAPVGDAIRLLTKTGEEEWHEQEFPGFAFVPLVRDPMPPRESNSQPDSSNEAPIWRRRRWLLAVLLFLFIFLLSGVYLIFIPLRFPTPKVRIEIPAGLGSRAIADLLKSKGIIRSRWTFAAYTALTEKASALKPGRYEFNGKIAVPELIDRLVKGELYPNERSITIPEGWDVGDIGRYLEAEGIVSAHAWWETVGYPPSAPQSQRRGAPLPDFSKDFSFLEDKSHAVGLEGYLFPDTYRVFRDATARDVAKKMLENFDRKLTSDLHAEIAQQKKTIFAVVILASLVEKEVPEERDRAIVAGILWKRLRAGIPLQVDATIHYITGRNQRPKAADLAIDSPYNTYRYPGLPRGPISNPSRGAIRAALFPQGSEYLYYLSSADGTTVFSKTLEEHVAAKRRYLK